MKKKPELRVLTGLTGEELEKTACEIFEVFIAAQDNKEMTKGYELAYFKEQLQNPEAINVAAIDFNGKIFAYLLAIPYMDAYAELCEHDNEMSMDVRNEIVYIETIVSVAHQRIFLNLINTMMREAYCQGKEVIAMHTRKMNGLSAIIMQLYPVECLRTLPNWFNYGEPFDYLEGRLENVRWLQTATAS